jgi:hypothetical protein
VRVTANTTAGRERKKDSQRTRLFFFHSKQRGTILTDLTTEWSYEFEKI